MSQQEFLEVARNAAAKLTARKLPSLEEYGTLATIVVAYIDTHCSLKCKGGQLSWYLINHDLGLDCVEWFGCGNFHGIH